MSVPESLPHMTAVIERMREQVPDNLPVEFGVAPTGGAPFLVIYPDSGDSGWTRLCMTRSTITVRFWIHAVGRLPEQAMWAMDQARNALAGARVDVPGYRTQAITQTLGPQPLSRDQTVQPPLYLQVAEFSISSQRGSDA